MRREGAVEKISKDCSDEQMLHDAMYGIKIDPEALSAAHILYNAAGMEKHPDYIPARLRKYIKHHRDVAWKMICKKIEEAFTIQADGKRNAEFFRNMADAIETDPNGVDPDRSYIRTQVGAARACGLPMPEPRNLIKELRARGSKTSGKTLLRICEESRLPIPKPGRPRKKRDNKKAGCPNT